jgi:poly-gamma-glutamate synthesis protein (capsule biosynthesis protein)
MRLLESKGEVRLRLAAAGDVGIVGSARSIARREGYDALLAALAPTLRAAELGFANLEFPVGEPAWVRPGRSPEFWHDPELVPALARAGVRVVSIANNHIMDCGPRGLARTREGCAAAGIAAVGAAEDLAAARAPARLDTPGGTVVILAYAAASGDQARQGGAGLAPLDASLIREDLAHWRPRAGVLVVSVHWGSMYVDYPPPRVLELARTLADGGADVVLGHHPHLLQGFERRGRTLMLYSLGDAAFNCHAGDFHSRVGAATRLEGGVFTVLVAEESGLEYTPLRLDPDGIPRPADGECAAAQGARLQRLSVGMAEAGTRFSAESAPTLLRYELEALGHWVRAGQFDRIARLLGSIRPRHLALLWQAVRRPARRP